MKVPSLMSCKQHTTDGKFPAVVHILFSMSYLLYCIILNINNNITLFFSYSLPNITITQNKIHLQLTHPLRISNPVKPSSSSIRVLYIFLVSDCKYLGNLLIFFCFALHVKVTANHRSCIKLPGLALHLIIFLCSW